MVSWQRSYEERWYSRSSGYIDGRVKFHEICREAVAGAKTPLELLEIGSGPPNPSSDFFAQLGRLTGVDIDPVVLTNPSLSLARTVDDDVLPFPDNTFDACFSNWVLEHVADPVANLREVGRVLKPGGIYIARTPNRFHYTTMVAAATPHWFHKLVANRLRNFPPEAHEPWETYYRLNTSKAAIKAADKAGLDVVGIYFIESLPAYGRASRVLFLLFMAYERMVNSSKLFEKLRHTMIIVSRKLP